MVTAESDLTLGRGEPDDAAPAAAAGGSVCLSACLSVRGAGCGRALRKAAGGSSWHRYMYVEHDVHVEIVLPTLVQH